MPRSTLNPLRKPYVWAPAVALGIGLTTYACQAPPLESPSPQVTVQTPVRVEQNVKNKVDILFMVDNSNSMMAMSDALRQKFGEFFKVFQDLSSKNPPTNADLHIGVVTSDYGAGATGAPGCQPSPGGQQGKLQALGAAADVSCKSPVGANFIRYDFANPTASNLPSGQNLVQTFSCMASVGAGGCGFEHQLESVYAALHNNLAENQGFIRDDALLVVVFLTNEDDSSAPTTTHMFDKNLVSMYGYESSYRQTRWGVQCDSSPDPNKLTPYADSAGPLAGCHAATNPPGEEYDISRYINFFSKPASQGGAKVNPLDVILVGIDGPESPVQIILSNPGTPGGQPFKQCSPLNETSNPPCVPVLQHSCQNSAQPEFFGDPAVRLNTVIKSVKNSQITSICDADYTGALQGLAQLIVSNIGGGCIAGKLADPKNPDCVVEDQSQQSDGTTKVTEIPSCTTSGGATPCWKAEVKMNCASTSPDSIGITIDRGGMSAPPNTTAAVYCSTLAQ